MQTYSTLLNRIFISWLFLMLLACGSSQLKIESDPSGAVVIVHRAGQGPHKLGETPLALDEAALKTESGSLFEVTVEKDGYSPQTAAFPSSIASSKSNLFIALKATEKDKVLAADGKSATTTLVSDDQLEKLASGVAQVQQFIKQKRLDDAEKTLNVLLVGFPRVSVLYNLLGNVNYLRHNVDQALSSYKKSQTLQSNDETLRMIKKLEDIKGPRLPANAQ